MKNKVTYSLQQIAISFIELFFYSITSVMSADVLLVFNGRGISFLITIHTNTIKLGSQTNNTFHHLQIIIENKTSMLKNQDLEQGLNTRVTNIWSLSLNHVKYHYIIHAGGHDCKNNLLSHLADNFRSLARSSFYTWLSTRVSTSCCDQGQISKLPI